MLENGSRRWILIKRKKKKVRRSTGVARGTIYNIQSSVNGGFSGNLFFARKSFCPLARVGRYIGRDRWEEIVVRQNEQERKERKRERERERGGGDRGKWWREVKVGGRVILLLMCVTRSTRPRTHHHRDNGVGGSRRRDAGWSGPPRFATKTATQRPCPELHDHKIILVLCHPARPSPSLFHRALVRLPRVPIPSANS